MNLSIQTKNHRYHCECLMNSSNEKNSCACFRSHERTSDRSHGNFVQFPRNL